MGNPTLGLDQSSERWIHIPFSNIIFQKKQSCPNEVHFVALDILSPFNSFSWHGLLNNVTATLAIGKCSRRNQTQVFRDGDCDVYFSWSNDPDVGGPENLHTPFHPYLFEVIKNCFSERVSSIDGRNICLDLSTKKPTIIVHLESRWICQSRW